MNVLRSVVLASMVGVGVLLLLPAHAPVSVSYVYSDSMEPTLSPGDGYVLRATDDVAAGDVVTFWSGSKDEFVTHRVVAVTERGLVTKGDANDATDQAAGHPPVDRDAVVGEAVTVGGSVLALPGFGLGVEALRSNREYAVGAAVVASALSVLRGRDTGRDERGRRLRVGHAYVGAFVLACGVVTALFVTTSMIHRWEFVVTASGSTSGQAVGESLAFQESVARPGNAFVDSFVHVRGLASASVASTPTAFEVTGTVPARSSTGVRSVAATTYRYPAVLPRAVLDALRAVHPLAAVAVSVSVALSIPFVLAGALADLRRPLRAPDWLARRR
ncbi:signal peptidase I [Halorubellus sp. PRR65]|uniref:signal peptidase I n=1 Tax=Halorubellus sp. PRR65 TaxID=3098148 RepID=UPI002B264079|nr:signal peptidase I [Halorubellus sp. PRR65]